jgi:hypothetical protein
LTGEQSDISKEHHACKHGFTKIAPNLYYTIP